MIDSSELRNVSLLRGLNEADLNVSSELCSSWECVKGQFVFKEKDVSENVYVILSGSVEVIISTGLLSSKKIASFSKGDIFGEMAFVDGEKRAASVRCIEDCSLLSMTRNDFKKLGRTHPHIQLVIFKNIARILAVRLRKSDTTIRELCSKDKKVLASLQNIFVV